MINWLLGLLPAPIRAILFGVGVIAYFIALIKPGTTLATICGMIALLSGATSILGEAREAAGKLGQTQAAMRSETSQDAPGTTQTTEVGVYQGDGPGVAQRSPEEAGYDPFKPS